MSPERMPLSPHRANGQEEGGGKRNGGEGLLFVYVSVGGFVYPEPLSTGQRSWLRWSSRKQAFPPPTLDYHDQGAAGSRDTVTALTLLLDIRRTFAMEIACFSDLL